MHRLDDPVLERDDLFFEKGFEVRDVGFFSNGWLVLAAVLVYAILRLTSGYSDFRGRFDHIAAREAAFLDAVAEVMFPVGGAIPLSGVEANLPRYVDGYLSILHGRQRLQIRLLLLFFEQATIFFPAPGRLGFRRFSALDLDQRLAVLRAWSQSRFFLRRLLFTALRAVLVLGYLGHPDALRHLRLAPYEVASPVCEADLLYPPIGKRPEDNPLGVADLTPPSDGTPIDLEGPLHADYAEKPL